MGGLGNQLFQYAAGRALATRATEYDTFVGSFLYYCTKQWFPTDRGAVATHNTRGLDFNLKKVLIPLLTEIQSNNM